jgi:hypothetical protein
MYIENHYYDLLAFLSYYTVLFIERYLYCIIYIWARSNARPCTWKIFVKGKKTAHTLYSKPEGVVQISYIQRVVLFIVINYVLFIV